MRAKVAIPVLGVSDGSVTISPDAKVTGPSGREIGSLVAAHCENGEMTVEIELEGDQFEWVQRGVSIGWCSDVVCATHGGLPSTDEEQSDWDEGGDPCEHAVRIWQLPPPARLPGSAD